MDGVNELRILAMLENPTLATAIAELSDDEIEEINASVPPDDDDDDSDTDDLISTDDE